MNGGFDVNAETTAGVTPSQSALAAGHLDVVARLKEAGGVKRARPALSGYRSILDVAGDLKGESVVDELGRVHKRPPYVMQF